MNEGDAGLTEVLVRFARHVREAQELARRLGYLAASVEENIEDVSDFHAAVESLVGAAPVSDSARRLLAVMGDEDRRLLRETRRARNALVYDFFIDHPVEGRDGAVDPAAVARAGEDLVSFGATLSQARTLAARLEIALAADD